MFGPRKVESRNRIMARAPWECLIYHFQISFYLFYTIFDQNQVLLLECTISMTAILFSVGRYKLSAPFRRRLKTSCIASDSKAIQNFLSLFCSDESFQPWHSTAKRIIIHENH